MLMACPWARTAARLLAELVPHHAHVALVELGTDVEWMEGQTGTAEHDRRGAREPRRPHRVAVSRRTFRQSHQAEADEPAPERCAGQASGLPVDGIAPARSLAMEQS